MALMGSREGYLLNLEALLKNLFYTCEWYSLGAWPPHVGVFPCVVERMPPMPVVDHRHLGSAKERVNT